MLCTSKITTCENVFIESNEIKLNKKLTPKRGNKGMVSLVSHVSFLGFYIFIHIFGMT